MIEPDMGWPPLDIEETRQRYLVQCGPHDYGMPEYGCNCGPDPRGVLMRALDELEALRAQVQAQS
jgi:hypothetical protein